MSLNRRLSPAAAKERLNQARDSGVLLEELQADEAGFHRISIRIKKYAGIHLPASPKNLSLVSGRLHSVIRGLGLKSYLEYDK